MASYYKHKATHSRKVPYSFQCEHCMKDSGPLTATISGNQREYNSASNTLTEQQKAKLNQDAHASLKIQMRTNYTNATEKQIFSPAFKDECPHCQKPQSWGVSGAKSGMATSSIAIVIVGVLVSLGTYFFTDVKSVTFSLVIVGASILAAAAVLLYKLAKVNSKAKKAATGLQKNLPVIDWAVAEDLLSES